VDVIQLAMSADGRMAVPDQSVGHQLDADQFGHSARLLSVTGAR
jgi:hypothetical protein